MNEWLDLVQRFPLRPIRTRKEHQAAMEMVFELFQEDGNLSRDQTDYLTVLTDLITQYEARFDVNRVRTSPKEALTYLMEVNSLRQVDIAKIIGHETHVSMFLSGKRDLSKSEAVKLGERFCVDPLLFTRRLTDESGIVRTVARDAVAQQQVARRAGRKLRG
jgi:HTH-type transcriptional regulator/antitoxin HigA